MEGLNATRATSNAAETRASGRTPAFSGTAGGRTEEEPVPEEEEPFREDEDALVVPRDALVLVLLPGPKATAPGPPRPAKAPASRMHTLSPSATASIPPPRDTLSALLRSAPLSTAGRSSFGSANSGRGFVSNDPGLNDRRRCTRSWRGDASTAPPAGNTNRGGGGGGGSANGGGSARSETELFGFVPDPKPPSRANQSPSRRRRFNRSHAVVRDDAKRGVPASAARSFSSVSGATASRSRETATPSAASPSRDEEDSSSDSTSDRSLSLSSDGSASVRALPSRDDADPVPPREEEAPSGKDGGLDSSASASAAAFAAAAARGVRHRHPAPTTVPAPQSQKKRDSREYTTRCPA